MHKNERRTIRDVIDQSRIDMSQYPLQITVLACPECNKVFEKALPVRCENCGQRINRAFSLP